MKIVSGKIQSAKKLVIYGPEGVGKSSFLSKCPNPLFIDTEGSTKELDVNRFEPAPTSWSMLKEQVKFVIANKPCSTLCIDTADWAERLCGEYVCSQAGKKGIEDFGYGNGFTYINEEFGRFLNLLNDVVDAGINVAIAAHSQLIKFEQPDEAGAYDRYELKLGIRKTEKRTAALLKEWADTVLFVNYKTLVIATDDKGTKHKGYGNERVMYTTHHACWDAKNRWGLPDECKFDYSVIAAHVPDLIAAQQAVAIQPVGISDKFNAVEDDTPQSLPQTPVAPATNIPDGIPAVLADLMKVNGVTEAEIREVVAEKGHFPVDTPVSVYPEEYVNGVLVAAWEQVFEAIKENRPF